MRSFTSAAICCLLMICSPVALSHACTSFCLDAPDGPVYATNMDLNTGEGHLFVNRRGIAKEGYRASTTGETAKWVAKYGSVTFNLGVFRRTCDKLGIEVSKESAVELIRFFESFECAP